jgi:archaellum component FlaC
MIELKLRAKNLTSIKQIITSALLERLKGINEGIEKTKMRLKELETQYNLSSQEFINLFYNNELDHSFDFDEWIGELKMLEHLEETKTNIEGIEFVN